MLTTTFLVTDAMYMCICDMVNGTARISSSLFFTVTVIVGVNGTAIVRSD